MIATLATYNAPHRLRHRNLARDFQRLADLGVSLIAGQENADGDAARNCPRGWERYRPRVARSAVLFWNPLVWEATGPRGAFRVHLGVKSAPRYIVWADLRHRETGIVRRFGSVHLAAFKTRGGAYAKEFRHQERKAAEWLAASPDRVLLGDLNSSPGGKWTRRLERVALFQRPIKRTRGIQKIDHVLIPKGQPRAHSARTMKGGSDHRALIVDLPLRGAPRPPEPPKDGPLKISTRADWGAPWVPEDDDVDPLGVTWHYPGPGRFRFSDHAACLRQVKAWDAMHRARGSRMLEYGGVLCQHGYWIEGRSRWGRMISRPGSNGSRYSNSIRVSAQFMAGTSDAPPTEQEYRWMGEVTARFRKQGAGRIVDAHRDHYATSCPGDAIYFNLSKIKTYADEAAREPFEPKGKDEKETSSVWNERRTVPESKGLGTSEDGKRSAWSLLVTTAAWSKRSTIRLRAVERKMEALQKHAEEQEATLARILAAVEE